MNWDAIQSAGLALGGVAHKLWRSIEAEKFLAGVPPTAESFRKAAEFALGDAKGTATMRSRLNSLIAASFAL
jgi:xanthine dehydrogenase YagS FAD-binding subunit